MYVAIADQGPTRPRRVIQRAAIYAVLPVSLLSKVIAVGFLVNVSLSGKVLGSVITVADAADICRAIAPLGFAREAGVFFSVTHGEFTWRCTDDGSSGDVVGVGTGVGEGL